MITEDDPNSGAVSSDSSEAPDTTAEVADVQSERDKLKDQLLRLAADFDNFRKRSRRDVEDAKARGIEEAVREFLPIMDNLERAIAAAQTASDVQSIVDGVTMVLRLFEDAASRIGLVRIPAVGERFDPNVHDAVQQVPSEEHTPGEILSEVVPGYRLGPPIGPRIHGRGSKKAGQHATKGR